MPGGRRYDEAQAQRWSQHWGRRSAEYTDDLVNGWSSVGQLKDWVPDAQPPEPDLGQWVGNADRCPNGVAIGHPTEDEENPGVQGAVMLRPASAEGGLALVGMKNATPSLNDPGTQANAPLECAGSAVMLMGDTVVMEVPSAHQGEHYLLAGETVQLPDGRHVAPLVIGPTYVPAQRERITATDDHELDETPVVVLTLGPLANTYGAGISQILKEVRLEEESGRSAEFTVELWLQPPGGEYAMVVSEPHNIAGGSVNISDTYDIQNEVAAGSNIQMRVSAVGTHPQSDPWVRGSVRASVLDIRQG